jgi:hypothetical protein
MTTAHTSLPIKAHKGQGCALTHEVFDANDEPVAMISAMPEKVDFIVRACNAHGDLVRSVSDLLSELRAACDQIGMSEPLFDGLDSVKAGKAALAKVGAA